MHCVHSQGKNQLFLLVHLPSLGFAGQWVRSGRMEHNAYWLVTSKAAFVILPMVELPTPSQPPPFFPEWSTPVSPREWSGLWCACSKAEGGGVVLGIGVQVLFTPGPGWYLALKPRASWDLVSINQPLSLLLRFQLRRLGNSPAIQVLAC